MASDYRFQQSEKVAGKVPRARDWPPLSRGKSTEEPPAPESLEEPEPVAPPEKKAGGEVASKAVVDYVGPEERCMNCQHFDGATYCNLNKFKADEGGRCNRFEGGGEPDTGESEASSAEEELGIKE